MNKRTWNRRTSEPQDPRTATNPEPEPRNVERGTPNPQEYTPSMRSIRLFVVFTAALALGSAVPFGQTPPAGQVPPQPQIGTGLIAGQVVDATTGKLIPDAAVFVNLRTAVAARGAAGQPQATVDAQGRFVFGSLPAGNYALNATRPGYLGKTIQIILADGDRVLDARIRLTKTATLSGTLRDAAGDPVVGTSVVAMNRTIVNGQQQWVVANLNHSDDRGIYRISDLSPGDYVVCACGRDSIPLDQVLMNALSADPRLLMSLATRAISTGTAGMSLDVGARTYAPIFHQSSTTLGRATKIALAPGEDKTGVDMTLEIVRATRVSGTATGAPGPIPQQSMRLVPAEYAGGGGAMINLFSLAPVLVQPDGRFDFVPVPPGQYRLIAVYRGSPAGAGARAGGGAAPPAPPAAALGRGAAGPPSAPYFVDEPITVPETGLTNVAVTLRKAPGITGRIEFRGSTPPPTEAVLTARPLAVSLQPVNRLDPLASLSGLASGSVNGDATFAVLGALPGKYSVTPVSWPGYSFLKTVTLGGRDITDLPIEVADRDVADLVLTYGDTPLASIAITTNPATTSPPFDDAWALVFPADRKYWTEPAAAQRRFKQAAFTNKGTVTVDGLPAGDYLIVVTTGLDTDWQEMGRLEALTRRAQRLTLADGEKKTIEVKR